MSRESALYACLLAESNRFTSVEVKRRNFHRGEALEEKAGAETTSRDLVLQIVGSFLDADRLKRLRQIGRFHVPLRHFGLQQPFRPTVPILHKAPLLMLTASQMMRIRLLLLDRSIKSDAIVTHWRL